MLKITPKRRVLFVRRFTPVLLAAFGVFSFLFANLHSPQAAYATAASTVNFQARLQSNSGAIVPDGDYNVEFKLYNAASGGTALWTEDYTATSGPGSTDVRIPVADGYLSTALGSITPFPNTIDWSQQLYLTMNIGGTGATASWDGEMNPRLALTASPYAFQAGSASQASELSNTTSGNTSALTFQGSTHGNQNFVIQDQGAAGTYDLLTTSQANGSYVELQGSSPTQQTGQIDISGAATVGNIATTSIDTVTNTGLTIGGTNATGISLGNSGLNNLTIVYGSGLIKSAAGLNSSTAFQVQNASGADIFNVDTTSTSTTGGFSSGTFQLNDFNGYTLANVVGGSDNITLGNNSVTGTDYINDNLTTNSPTGTLKNSATWSSGNYVELNNSTNSSGEVEYTPSSPSTNFDAKFNFWATNGADSTYFYAFNTATPVTEAATDNGYLVAYDEYQGKVLLYYNGSLLTSYTATLGGSTWHSAEFTKNGTALTVYLDGSVVISYTDTARTLTGTLFGLGGRSGGVSGEHRVKNFTFAPYTGSIISLNGATQITTNAAAAFLVQNASSTPVFSVDTTDQEAGLGTLSNATRFTVSSSAVDTTNGSIALIQGSLTSLTNSTEGLRVTPNVAPTSNSTNGYTGAVIGPQSSDGTHLTNATLTGLSTNPYYQATSGTLGQLTGNLIQATNHSTATVTTVTNLNVQTVNNGGGTIGTNYGILISNPVNTGTITNNYAIVTQTNAGNSGFGTTTPATRVDVNGAVQQTGMATLSSGSTANQWAELGQCKISVQFAQCLTTVNILGGYDGGAGQNTQATISARVKQQAALGGAPLIDLTLNGQAELIKNSDIMTITTENDATATVVQLWGQIENTYEQWNYTPTLNDSNQWTWTPGTTLQLVGGLPAGAQQTATYADTYAKTLLVQGSNSSTAFQVQNTGSINLMSVNTSTNSVNVGTTGTDAVSSTVNIATSTGASQTIHIGDTSGETSTVTVGSLSSTSTTSIQGGSGGVGVQVASGGTISIGTSGVAETVQIGQSGTGAVTQTIGIGNGGSGSTTNVTVGNANAGTTTIQGATGITLSNNTTVASGKTLTVPTIYGSSASGGNITIDSTSNGTKGSVILAPSGGNVAIGESSGIPSNIKLDVKGAVQQTGLTTSNTSNTNNGNWTELGSCTINVGFSECLATLNIQGGFGGGTGNGPLATVTARVKQQNALGGLPYINLTIGGNLEYITKNDIMAITTENDATATVVQLYGRINDTFDAWLYTPVVNAGNNTGGAIQWQWTPSSSFVSTGSLPAGTQTAAIYDDSVANTLLVQGSNSSTAFQVQNSNSVNLMSVNTSTNNVNIGTTGTDAVSSTVNIATSTGASQTVHVGDGATETSTITIGSTNSTSATTIQAGSGGITLNGAVTMPATSGDNLTVNENATFGTQAGTTLTVGINNVPNAKLNVNTGSSVAFRAYQAGSYDVGQFATTGTGVGTVATNGTTTVTGTGTQFTQYFQVGDGILIGSNLTTVSTIASGTSLTTVATITTGSSQTYYRGIVGAGTVTTSGANVTGTGTSFTTAYQVGDSIAFNGASTVYTVASITDNTHMTLYTSATSLSGVTYARIGYDRLDVKANGNVGIGTNNASAALNIQTDGVGQSGFVLQGASGQTAQLLTVEDNSSNEFLGVTAAGDVQIASNLDTATNVNLEIGQANSTGTDIGNTSMNNLTTIYGSGLVKSTSGNNSTNAFQVQASGGGVPLTVDTLNNAVNIGSTTQIHGAQLNVVNTNSANRALIIQGASGQSADLLDMYTNGGTFVSGYDVNGNEFLNGYLQTGTTSTAGKIQFKDGTANNYNLSLKTTGLAENYTLTLPTDGASASGQCLQSGSGSTTASTNLTFGSCGSGGGVSALGAVDGAGTANANGATISGSTLYLNSADGTHPGALNATTQTIGGAKTFSSLITGSAGISTSGGAVTLQGNAASSLTTTTGNLTLQAAGTSTISADTAGAGTVNLGATNATTVKLGNTKTATQTTIQGGTNGISIQTGSASSGSTGNILIQSGDATGGTSGNVLIDTGAASTTSNAGSIETDNFEGSNDGWSNWVNDTVAQSTAQHHGGTHSMAVTSSTGSTSWGVQSSSQTVVPGESYTFSAWVYLPSAETLTMNVSWGSEWPVLETISVPANTWTLMSGTAIAPAGATNEQIELGSEYAVPNSTLVAYVDDASITGSETMPLVSIGNTNAAGVSIGNANEVGNTSIQGGVGGVSLSASAGGNITVGTTTDTNMVITQAAGISQTVTGSTTAPSDIVKTTTNSANAFNVQNSSGTNLVNVDTAGGNVNLGIGGTPPGLGYTPVGGTTDTNTNFHTTISADRFTANYTGMLSSISVYVSNIDGVSNRSYVVGVYADTTCSGNPCPGTLIAQSAASTLGSSAGWNTAAISASVTSGTHYWLVYSTNASATSKNTEVYDSSVGGMLDSQTAAYSSTMPSTFVPAGAPISGPSHSIYAAYASGNPALSINSSGNLAATGAATFADVTNSTAAFQIQNSGGASLFTADTTDNQIQLGTNTGLYLSGTTAYISNPQGQSGGEAFGAGATLQNGQSVAVGNGATAAWGSVAVGYGATNNNASNGVAIGDAASSNWNSIVIGNGATGQQHTVTIGTGASAANYSIAIGENTNTNGNQGSIILGESAQATAANQLVIGGSVASGGDITDAYFGSGVNDTAPQNFTIHTTGVTSGTANTHGADLNIASGIGTGNQGGGDINLQVAPSGASGSSQNTLQTVVNIAGSTGAAVFQNASNTSSAFLVKDSGNDSLLNVDTSAGITTVSNPNYGVALQVNGAVQQTGIYTPDTNSTPDQWLEIGDCTLTGQYDGCKTTFSVSGGLNGGIPNDDIATVYFQVYQQNAMGGTPTVDVSVYNSDGSIAASDFKAYTTTNSGSQTTVQIWGQIEHSYEYWNIVPQMADYNSANSMFTWTNANAFATPPSVSQIVTGSYSNLYGSDLSIQNSSGYNVLSTSSSSGIAVLGTSSHVNGAMVLDNSSNSNTVTIQSGATTTSYSLTLPTALGSSGQCLDDTTGTGVLGWTSCGGSGGATNANITYVNDWDEHSGNSLTISPSHLGDVIVLGINLDGTTTGVAATSVSGCSISNWSKAVGNLGNATNYGDMEIWTGTVVATGSCSVTIAYSGSLGSGEEVSATEFTAAGVSPGTTWNVMATNTHALSSSQATVTFPSITPTLNQELYFGYGSSSNNQTGTTSGAMTFISTGWGNGIFYDAGTASGTPYQPTDTQPNGAYNTAAVAIAAYNNSSSISNSTSTQQANFNVQAATSGSVAATLQANASGSGHILDLKNGAGSTVDSFDSNGNMTITSSASTGTGMTIAANSLTTGYAASVTSTSALQTAGSLLNVSSATTLTTNGGSYSGQLASFSRSLTANVGSTTEAISHTFTPVGAATSSAPLTTPTFAPPNVGDIILVSVLVSSSNYASCSITGITYSSAGTWTRIAANGEAPGSAHMELWSGIATSTTTHTLTFTYNSGTCTGVTWNEVSVDSFHAAGSPTWNTSNNGWQHWAPGNGNIQYPTLSATSTNQIYWGESDPQQTFSSGNCSSGFTCTALNGGTTGVTRSNSALTSGTPYTPTGSQTSGNYYSDDWGVILEADVAGGGSANVTGPVASFSSNCAITAGSCSDGSSVVSINQQYASATGAALSIQNAGTGSALSVTNNNLTTGNGVNISTTSALQTAGSLFNVSDTATLTTANITGSLANISRLLTANVSSAGTPTLDNASTFNMNGSAATFSNTYTVGSGHSNYYMLVGVFDDIYQGQSSVTYGGVSMTFLGQTGLGTGTTGLEIFALKAPATGANKLVVTGNPKGEYSVVVEDYYNVNQSTPYGTFSTNHSNSGNPTIAATSANGRVVTDLMAATGTNAATNSVLTTGTHNANQVQATFSGNAGIEYGPGGVGASYAPASGTPTNMYWTTGTGWWGEAAVDLIGATNGSQSVTGAAASVSDNCTNTSGTCANGSSVLNLNEQYSGATGAVLSIQNSGTGDMINLSNGSGTVARISSYGSATFQNSTNTTSAFQIQNSSAANVFNVDTTNGGAVTITNNVSITSPAITEAGGGSVENDAASNGNSSLSISPTTIGDMEILGINLESSNTVTKVTGGGVSNWQLAGVNPVAGFHQYIFIGRITATGASTISVTYSGGVTQASDYTELIADEFTSAYGANTSWSVVASSNASNTTTLTLPYPTITTTQANQMYWGYGYGVGNNATTCPAGSNNTGFTCEATTDGNGVVWNAGTRALIPYAPTQTQTGTANGAYTVGVIISATPTTGSALNVNGSSLISASSTTALQVNNASGNSILSVDSNNGYVIIGKGATGETNPSLLVLDSGLNSVDPVEVDGGMYYNSITDQFRCGVNGAWTNCINGTVSTVASAMAATAGFTAASGTVYFAPVYIPGPMTVNNFRVGVNTACASTHGDVGLYDTSGNLILDAGASALTTSSAVVQTLAPAQTGAARNLSAGQYIVAITLNTACTNVFEGYTYPTGGAGTYKYVGNIGGVGGTSLPSTITPSSISTGGSQIFIGLSN